MKAIQKINTLDDMLDVALDLWGICKVYELKRADNEDYRNRAIEKILKSMDKMIDDAESHNNVIKDAISDLSEAIDKSLGMNFSLNELHGTDKKLAIMEIDNIIYEWFHSWNAKKNTRLLSRLIPVKPLMVMR